MLPITVRHVLGVTGLLLIAGVTSASAQATGSVTGRVTEATTLRPLGSAQVSIPGTGIGALANANGAFLLVNVPAGQHTVRAELIGYGTVEQTVTVTAGAAVTSNFGLATKAIALGEIVVTGTGQASERRQIGNLIETVNVAALQDAPVRSASELLQARTPGVVINVANGVAGSGSRIRIRGSASLTQGNAPVVYLDGVRIDSELGTANSRASRLDDINPESIDRIEILKGAAAATLYGTEASSGVIQIFTKSGRSGAPRWTLGLEVGVSKQLPIPPLAGFALAEGPSGTRDKGSRALSEHFGMTIRPFEVFEFDLYDYVFETGRHTDNTLSVSGGTGALTYNIGGRYSIEDGIIGGKQYREPEDVFPIFYSDIHEVKQGDANVHLQASENVRMEVSARFTEREQNPGHGDQGAAGVTPLSKIEQAHEKNYIGKTAFNTFREAMRQQLVEETNRFGGAFTTRWALTPALDLKATTGIDVVNAVTTNYQPFGWNVDGYSNSDPQGRRNISNRARREVTVDAMANWRADFGSQFTSTITVGTQTLMANTRTVGAVGANFPAVGLEVAGAGTVQTVTENINKSVSTGVYAQQQIGFRDNLFVTYGARVDRHSAFGENAGAAIYPKVSFSWVASQMLGWSGSTLSTLRLRGSLGQSGKQPGAFDKFTTWAPVTSVEGGGIRPQNLGNADLKPEVSTEWEAGFEAGLFADRVAFDATYWNRTVSDLLVNQQFPPSGGFTNSQLVNIGEMKAWGTELSLTGRAYSSPSLSVDLYVNGAYLHQKITDMGGAAPIGGGARNIQWVREGYPPGAMFGAELVDGEYFDTNLDGKPDALEQILQYLSVPRTVEQMEARTLGKIGEIGGYEAFYKGKTTPDWTGSMGADIAFGNFTFRNNFAFSAGNYKAQALHYEFRQGHPTIGRNMKVSATWDAQLMNPASTPEQRLEAARWFANNAMGLGRLNGLHQARKADFISWREASLTYQVPSELAGLFGADALTITAAGRNITKFFNQFPGMDQESVDGGDSLGGGAVGHLYAAPRRFSVALRVNF